MAGFSGFATRPAAFAIGALVAAGDCGSGSGTPLIFACGGVPVVVAFDANNPGWWAFHCHLVYRLDAGMFTTLCYD
jgi:FtsP/CotA-like multicopper oxidase with cupredoxin domain